MFPGQYVGCEFKNQETFSANTKMKGYMFQITNSISIFNYVLSLIKYQTLLETFYGLSFDGSSKCMWRV